MAEQYRLALAGNPNCGKTTLFNRLTGSSQSVGNWPGVTVEKKEGRIRGIEQELHVVDLPGIYSLYPYSPEEEVAFRYLLSGEPDLILNIVDGTNLERNLYLTTQLAELGIPMVVALNMADVLEKRGDTVDWGKLERGLGVPVVPISAGKGTGVPELVRQAVETIRKKAFPRKTPLFSPKTEEIVEKLESLLREPEKERPYLRFSAVRLLEGDEPPGPPLSRDGKRQARELRERIAVSLYLDRPMVVADERYRYLCGLCAAAVRKAPISRHKGSAAVDRILTNRVLGLPLFFAIMLAVFWITFGSPGSFLTDWTAGVVKEASIDLRLFLREWGVSGWVESLAIDGIYHGVGAVVSFLPQIVLLFALLSLLEDSGYMARAAFMMDRVLRKLGLSGRAFVPLLMGFGCTVPAVMGTRILEREKDKRLTILITPFMSCSAKMPVYTLIVSAVFVSGRPLVIFSLYALGILLAVLSALLFKNTLLKGDPAPFVMELPPYRRPTLQSCWIHIRERLRDFLVKAGTVLVAAAVVVWFLQYFSPSLRPAQDTSQSILAGIGRAIAPVFSLCGFGDWRSAVSLFSGLVAKESVISTMQVLYPGGSLATALSQVFTPVSAYAFLIFVLLYPPCIAALSAIRREMGSLKWAAVTVVYQLGAAWLVSALFYQWATLIFRLV